MTSDSYHTLAGPAEAIYKEKSSKFLAYAYPVESEEEIRTLLDALRKQYYEKRDDSDKLKLDSVEEDL